MKVLSLIVYRIKNIWNLFQAELCQWQSCCLTGKLDRLKSCSNSVLLFLLQFPGTLCESPACFRGLVSHTVWLLFWKFYVEKAILKVLVW